MQAQETILFVCVVVLATALIVVLVGPRLRVGRWGTGRGPKLGAKLGARLESGAKPAVSRSKATTAVRATPPAAQPPTAPGTPAASSLSPPPPHPPAVQMICPTCRRRYATGLRFCPYDARVLAADVPHPERTVPHASSVANAGKICPTCSRRYDTIAVVCGRDGTALVSVN